MTATQKEAFIEIHDSMPRMTDTDRTYSGYGATLDRPAPKYVRSIFAWERASQKIGKPYQDWAGKDFAIATKIYQHTIRKYGFDQPGPDQD